jgi:hypothetical protein
MKKLVVVIMSLIFLSNNTSLFAKIKLPGIIASNMVLQRNTSVKIWGWANSGEKISIKTSWIANEIKITTPENGRWEVLLKTTLSKDPQTIKLSSLESNIKLENILLDTTTMTPLIIDLGLSKVLLGGQTSNDPYGTLAYCSPEIVKKSEHTESDLV